jgi:hypothetical protein
VKDVQRFLLASSRLNVVEVRFRAVSRAAVTVLAAQRLETTKCSKNFIVGSNYELLSQLKWDIIYIFYYKHKF